MPILSVFRRHPRFAAQADAYADGELRGHERERFEAHLAACATCAARVAGARQLKAAIGRLPEAAAPRSFQLTRAMAERGAERAVAKPRSTPVYLSVARMAAGLAVVAFAGALAFSALGGEDGDSDEAAGGAAEISLSAAEAPVTSGPKDAAYDSAATGTPQLAPAATGGAAGSSVETPVAPLADNGATRSSNAPPGQDTQPVPAAQDDDGATSGVGIGPAPEALVEQEDEDSVSVLLFGLGLVAVAAVAVLGGLEVTRRVRR